MSFVTTQTGQLYFLKASTSQLLLLHLFSNDRTPSVTDTITNYTEVVYVGYTPKLLTPSEWVFQIDTLSGNYYANFAQQIFTTTGSLTVFGYYITDSAGTKLLTVERFTTAPVTLQSGTGGGNIKVTPTIGAR